MTPEARARQTIDALLNAAGWHVCDVAHANLRAGTGVAIREFPLNAGHGFADYLLYVNGKACGVIEAKKVGSTLSGVEVQSARYAQGLPASLPAWRRPLPFVFESTGVETRFTNGLDPLPRARPVFAFFRPELLVQWLSYLPAPADFAAGVSDVTEAPTFLRRMQSRPPLVTEWGQGGASYKLWPAQIEAVTNLEKSLAANKPRALIQMATGSGKTFTAISAIYRLIKFGGARRVLFLVDRGNLARQTKKEFDAYASPHNAYKFGEEFIVQHLQGGHIDGSARVVISTIQRMFSLLKGKDLPDEADEESTEGAEALFKDPEPIGYNPAVPIETFDIVITDEAHRSIYNLWRQVLEYFDAYLIGLTATPNKQTFGFFNQNLVMEYGHAQAVADGVNVNYDVYRIRTEVGEQGARVDKGYWLETQDKATRRKTAWLLDDDFEYQPEELDRAVQTPDQIRTVVRTLRDRWQVDLFPQRQELPKTLIFAKDDKAAVEGRLVETEASIARREGRGYETGAQLLQRVLEDRQKQWKGRGKYKPPQPPADTEVALPEGWVWVSIDQLAEVGTGATPSRSNPAFWDGGDIPWVSSSVVNADQVTEATEFVAEQALAETNLTVYPPGTLLLAMYGEGKTRGKCTELRIHATTNQALAALQTSADVRGYLRHFLEHNYEEMRKVASGGVQPNLNLSLVRSVCVPLPPVAEQVRISAEIDRQLTIVRGVDAEVDANLLRAAALRQSTLSHAFGTS